ncbi:hypothetical protein WR25_09492 [Diploscapter pachys]|uniref:Uncharacterized protein n=1 Tax=Diploscapter pachys TaxID=2018661 RepID=A0A2A2K2N4_9BILA|nr:hypothetical protein WR25_17093 [Diploscapter pachys]PAV68140.1 hypothetical protein WR25_09492 [Diploscapter pachys]
MAVERIDSRKFFGVVVDDKNKVHYYNCKPISQKKSQAKPLPKPLRYIASLFGYKKNQNDTESVSSMQSSKN